MEQYKVRLTGLTPLIMHSDNMAFGEKIRAWQLDPANKENSEKGDDRSPPWTWLGYLYHNTKVVGIPSDNLMTMLREGGAKLPTGWKTETYKKQTQAGLMVDQEQFKLLVSGSPVQVEPLNALIGDMDFQHHLEVVESLGFELLVKRAKVGSSKHVRVRPMFRQWELVGSITVIDTQLSGLTASTMETILNQAGALCGLGDWRPSSPRASGSFGKFAPTIERI